MSDGRVYVVGGAGYIGSHLIPALNADGWEPVIIDAGIYGHMPAQDKVDILDDDFQIPEDGAPVIWLATLHMEPPGFATMEKDQQSKWIDLAHRLMVKEPHRWLAAGHPVVYASSQMSFTRGDTLYGQTKRMFEASAVGNFVQIFRFGTVWGGLTRDPARPQTALNAALLGKYPPAEYLSYTTSIQRAVSALVLALYRPFNGTVENVFDSEEPITGQVIRDSFNTFPKDRTHWQIEFVRSADISSGRKRSLKRRKHPTELLASYYHLPWPEKTDVRKEDVATVNASADGPDGAAPAGDREPPQEGGAGEGAASAGEGSGAEPSDPSYDPRFRVVEKEGPSLGE